MRHARSLLSDASLSIEAVAERSGFRDAAYFSRAFRKVHGKRWSITVSDTGRGMDDERLRHLKELKLDGSFGFKSVIQRLRLQLNVPVQYQIESEPGRGTNVTIGVGLSGDSEPV